MPVLPCVLALIPTPSITLLSPAADLPLPVTVDVIVFVPCLNLLHK